MTYSEMLTILKGIDGASVSELSGDLCIKVSIDAPYLNELLRMLHDLSTAYTEGSHIPWGYVLDDFTVYLIFLEWFEE